MVHACAQAATASALAQGRRCAPACSPRCKGARWMLPRQRWALSSARLAARCAAQRTKCSPSCVHAHMDAAPHTPLTLTQGARFAWGECCEGMGGTPGLSPSAQAEHTHAAPACRRPPLPTRSAPCWRWSPRCVCWTLSWRAASPQLQTCCTCTPPRRYLEEGGRVCGGGVGWVVVELGRIGISGIASRRGHADVCMGLAGRWLQPRHCIPTRPVPWPPGATLAVAP